MFISTQSVLVLVFHEPQRRFLEPVSAKTVLRITENVAVRGEVLADLCRRVRLLGDLPVGVEHLVATPVHHRRDLAFVRATHRIGFTAHLFGCD